MKKWILIGLALLFAAIAGYLVSFTIVDANLMGTATPEFEMSVDVESYIIPESTRIDAQTGFKCSAFSSAYVMRHWGIEAHGDSVYEVMPSKMEGGYVYPKGIVSFLESNGFEVEYHIGNLNALKNEVAEGHPAIVMIKICPEEEWLHYVPVVGYTPDSIFIAESLPELRNAKALTYNRSISTADFKELWNTRSLNMPLYSNTFITAEK
ncbi:MAG: C39 family peptidase [Muribaculaceae bacterium]